MQALSFVLLHDLTNSSQRCFKFSIPSLQGLWSGSFCSARHCSVTVFLKNCPVDQGLSFGENKVWLGFASRAGVPGEERNGQHKLHMIVNACMLKAPAWNFTAQTKPIQIKIKGSQIIKYNAKMYNGAMLSLLMGTWSQLVRQGGHAGNSSFWDNDSYNWK